MIYHVCPNIKERKRAERRPRAIQEAQARRSHLRHLWEESRINEDKMSSQISGSLTLSLDKLSISTAPKEAVVGSA